MTNTLNLIQILFFRDLSNGQKIDINVKNMYSLVSIELETMLIEIPIQIAEVKKRIHVELEFQRDFTKVPLSIKGEIIKVFQPIDPKTQKALIEFNIQHKNDQTWNELLNMFNNLQNNVQNLFDRIKGEL